MVFSKTTAYGIRALAYLANQSESQLCGLQEIAEKEQIPSAYLGKILGELRKHQLLRSVKGIHGGYELARPAEVITLWNICEVLDPVVEYDECILGLDSCNETNACALHESWTPLRTEFIKLLKTKTIDQIAKSITNAEKHPAKDAA
ncbi:MAG: Rrf2 family transcriptional regulator [Acidobacteriota bacterium]|nr:Rrf2 family transcriptional regulator [Acidobacteriota bacterium]MDH3530231.1 Rrf2 family transcriptional regulator [Acidobacteriota bacterium]